MTSSSMWDALPQAPRRALTVALMQGVPAESFALYARWWQLETWLRSLAYVELRARDGVAWIRNLGAGTIGRQANDQTYSYMASPDWDDPLAYLDASKLFDLIEAHWELFEGQLIERKAWDGRRDELLKIRNRIGHLRRPHRDDLDRLEQTLRDLDRGALTAVLAYHRRYDPTLICKEDDPVVAAWIQGDHDDARRLINHAATNYDTDVRVSLAARPWAEVPPGDERVAPGTPGFVWHVDFWMRGRYLRVSDLWRDSYLDRSARKLLIHMLVGDICRVTVTFPMVDDGVEVGDAIGNLFDAVLTSSSSHYPGDLTDLEDDPLSRVPPLDPGVQVNSTWSIELPEDRPFTIFSA